MSARRSLGTRIGVLLMLVAPFSVGAAESVEDHLGRKWYVTEMVVFQRPQVMDYASDEDLVRRRGGAFAVDMRAFRPGAEGLAGHYDLPPAGRAGLVYPHLDLSALGIPFRLQAGLAEDAEPSSRQAAGAVGGEPPPAIQPSLGPDPLLDYLAELGRFEAELEAQSRIWLPPENFTLTTEAQRLARLGGFQVLLHGRWLQVVPPRETPEPLLIQAGRRYGDVRALEGTVAVTLGRYLHFHANLTYREPLLGQAPVDRALPPPELEGVAEGGALPGAMLPGPARPGETSGGYMLLSASRRMRSGELHYLDHPKLGVLVRIDPVEIPASVSAAFAALQEDAQ